MKLAIPVITGKAVALTAICPALTCYDDVCNSDRQEAEMTRRYTIQAVIYPGDDSGYVAECLTLAVVTQGKTLDETVQNLRDAIHLHLEGEDLVEMGLVSHAPLLVTMEMDPIYA